MECSETLTKQQQKMLLAQRFSFSLFSTCELEVIRLRASNPKPYGYESLYVITVSNRRMVAGYSPIPSPITEVLRDLD